MWFDFTKIAPKMKVQAFFCLWRSCFYLVLFGQFREIWAKMVLEVP